METLGPTPEARQHDTYEPPARDQRTNRTAYRRIPIWEHELRQGLLTEDQARAAETFHRYWHGSQGADVRTVEGGIAYDPSFPAQEHYSSQLHHAQSYVRSARLWNWLERFAVLETPLVSLGREMGCSSKTPSCVRHYAAGKITEALDAVASAWGIGQHARAREREPA